MPHLLFRLAGLDDDDVTLVSPAELVAAREAGGLLGMLKAFVWRIVRAVAGLVYKVAAPDVVLRRILAILLLQITHEGIVPLLKLAWRSTWLGQRAQEHRQLLEDVRVRELRDRAAAADNYEEWREATRLLDDLTRPKQDKDSLHETARFKRMTDMTALYKRLVEEGNAAELMFRLRGELMRKHWGLGSDDEHITRDNPTYRAALADYMDTVCAALALIARGGESQTLDTMDLHTQIAALRERADFFSETLHSFGRTALLLSGGARLGMLHLGVVRCLRDQGLLPRIITGSSAGSIVAAMLGALKDEELDERLFNPKNVNLRFFAVVGEEDRANKMDDSAPASAHSILRKLMLLLPPPLPDLAAAAGQVLPVWLQDGTLLDVHVLATAIRSATGDLTFKEAYERTGRVVSITISPTGDRDFPMLLNYLTAPHVLLWSASVASCAIPGVFASVELLAKDVNGEIRPYFPEGVKWADGSVESDLPMERLKELFACSHFVVSQVNPHARLLAPMGKGPKFTSEVGASQQSLVSAVRRAASSATRVVVDFCRDETRSAVKHWATALMVLTPLFPVLAPLRILGKSLVPILVQKYTGDITIMPPLSVHGLVNILSNPSEDDYLEDLAKGERNTWPHVPRIRLHCAIEVILDDCRQTVRRQLARVERQLLAGIGAPAQALMGDAGASSRNLASGSAASLARMERRGIPTASVLNLSELDVAAPGLKPGALSLALADGGFVGQYKSPQLSMPNGDMGAGGSSVTLGSNGSPRLDGGRAPTTRQRASSSMDGVQRTPKLQVMRANTSFLNLSDKLKARVQSFAVGLNDMGLDEDMEEDHQGHDQDFSVGVELEPTQEGNEEEQGGGGDMEQPE